MANTRATMSAPTCFLRPKNHRILIYPLLLVSSSLADSGSERYLLSLGASSRSIENNRKAYASNKKGHLEHALNGREQLIRLVSGCFEGGG